MYGSHCVKTYCSTQATIMLSSAEAEYCSMVKSASLALGLQAMYQDMGQTVTIKCHTDASSAKSIAMRKGLGKLRHMAVHMLWLQQRVAAGEIEIVKVNGLHNPADLYTKYLTQEVMRRHMDFVKYAIEDGRASECPALTEG